MPLPEEIAAAAIELGFARVGFCPVERFERAESELEQWLERGYQGEMAYLSAPGRADPSALLAGARTLIVVALSYAPGGVALRAERDGPALTGSIARYARGTDYHQLIRDKLRALADRISGLIGRSVLARTCVDTAPLLEREAARRAGIGFTAKSTLLLAPGLGSYVLLGELLLDVELEPSTPIPPGCGSCRACLDACPTGAFVDANLLDARRCISYLTIELRTAIPRELRAPIGTRVFGCDACQEVCPYNASEGPPSPPELQGSTVVDLVEWLELTASGYRKLVKRRALRRASRQILARNAAVALGNTGDARAVAPLVRALKRDPSALVRSHVAWALGRLGGPDARAALQSAASADDSADVRGEAALALAAIDAPT